MLFATFLSKNVYVYLQPLLRNAAEFCEKKRKNGPFRRSRSFKVTDFGTNRKLIYDFLLVINTNLPHILHRLLRYCILNVKNRYHRPRSSAALL